MKILSGILKDLFDNLCLVDFLWWERTSLFNREQFLNVNDFSLLWEQSRCQTRFKKQPNNRTVNQASELGWTTLNSETEFPILLPVDRVYRNKHTQSHRITEHFRLEGTSGGYLVHPVALAGACWAGCPGLATQFAFEDFQSLWATCISSLSLAQKCFLIFNWNLLCFSPIYAISASQSSKPNLIQTLLQRIFRCYVLSN